MFENIREQVDYAKTQEIFYSQTQTGFSYRLFNWVRVVVSISAAFSCGADTLGVYFERPASGERTASAGFYNSSFLQVS